MRLRNIPGADDVLCSSLYVIQNPFEHKGTFSNLFGNENPIHIEIGMGKGRFITQMALTNPHINYIGIEMYSSVLLRAVQKMNKLEEENGAPKNLKFICVDARNLKDIFGPDEIDKIYLNFSDPWPKDRHAKRRLPSKEFLSVYRCFLKKEGTLEFKTDNVDLFNFALEELPLANWKSLAVTFDLHNDPELNKGNIMTEYEEKFSSKGNPICKYIIKIE
ncbi:MAG: tRNA (guanosine(46)-N7)-methyltransferase TrmB [Lachnospiraceae bacterium]|nr:tRNA (guanosine(46)-N7)-methyltransferase TrmB [Lachnospiraceae bacterium]